MAEIKIKLVRSGIGRPQKHKNTLKALGLNKMHRVVTKPDNPAVRGMIQKVVHLIEVVDG